VIDLQAVIAQFYTGIADVEQTLILINSTRWRTSAGSTSSSRTIR
jgi:hypothetical protein